MKSYDGDYPMLCEDKVADYWHWEAEELPKKMR